MRRCFIRIPLCLLLMGFLGGGCRNKTENSGDSSKGLQKGSFGYDRSFLTGNLPLTLLLRDSQGRGEILLSPEYQGRVLTSTAKGDSGASFGWINYGLIASHVPKKQFNPIGGEERFWVGPEGGQFGFYFNPGDSFTIAHWQVPPVIDLLPFRVDSVSHTVAAFSREALLRNYSGTTFQFRIDRTVQLLDRDGLRERMGISVPEELPFLAYESDNRIKNTGDVRWKKESGLLSIWLLGMMTPTDSTVVAIPFRSVANPRSYLTDDYFGKIPSDRLKLGDSLLYFRCDGRSRGKLGISPFIAGNLAASFDFQRNILTLIHFPVDSSGIYVNSKWEIQQNPFGGDVINSYNDGPLKDGSQLGPFYEIESSSAARELNPGESMEHRQITCHVQGSYSQLRDFARKFLGIDLEDLKKML
jgi:hypothetical protein